MNKRIIAIVFILIGVLCACQPAPATKAANPQFAKQWMESWVCEFPCWQNITPGVTKYDDAVSMLYRTDNVRVTFRSEDGLQFLDKMNVQGQVNKASSGLVWSISLIMRDQDITVGDLIQQMGFPAEVALLNDITDLNCTGVLIYPEKSTMLELYLDNHSRKANDCRVDITPDHDVSRIYIIGYGIEEHIKIAPWGVANRANWKGYGVYP